MRALSHFCSPSALMFSEWIEMGPAASMARFELR